MTEPPTHTICIRPYRGIMGDVPPGQSSYLWEYVIQDGGRKGCIVAPTNATTPEQAFLDALAHFSQVGRPSP